mmetsp:Transcript_26204/g.79587  ORF Transcript_26204/g.79587 Transcript_26204/m.79587 type:complete len:286 (-) Transcript_26204:3730-4587(-)
MMPPPSRTTCVCKWRRHCRSLLSESKRISSRCSLCSRKRRSACLISYPSIGLTTHSLQRRPFSNPSWRKARRSMPSGSQRRLLSTKPCCCPFFVNSSRGSITRWFASKRRATLAREARGPRRRRLLSTSRTVCLISCSGQSLSARSNLRASSGSRAQSTRIPSVSHSLRRRFLSRQPRLGRPRRSFTCVTQTCSRGGRFRCWTSAPTRIRQQLFSCVRRSFGQAQSYRWQWTVRTSLSSATSMCRHSSTSTGGATCTVRMARCRPMSAHGAYYSTSSSRRWTSNP